MDWLLAFPEKGYFVPIKSETTELVVRLVDAIVLSEPTEFAPEARGVDGLLETTAAGLALQRFA